MAVSNSNLSILLKKIAVEQHYTNFHINITPMSSGGANFTSKLYQIKVTGGNENSLQLFAKIAACPPKMREQFVMNMYNTEHLMYTEVVKVFRRLEKMWNISEEHKIGIPTYYGSDLTYLQEIIVLEDLSCRGFQMHSRLESVSWHYAAAAITELTKFHALSFVYQHEIPTGFEKLMKKLKSGGILTKNEANKVIYNSSCKIAHEAVREDNKDKLQRFLDRSSLAEYFNMYRVLRHPVIIHTDFRPSNILHKLRNNGSLEMFVVDYQTLQVGCPVIDLLYFIFTASDGPFRAKYYQQLLDHYYSELGSSLARFGLDIKETYSKEDFQFELREMQSFGLKMSVIVLPTLLISVDDAPPANEELNWAAPTGDIYNQRLNEVVDNYVAWGVLA